MTDTLITCPKCSTVLDRRATSGVEVDSCPSCGGLWLDQGELAKLKLRRDFFELSTLKRPSADRKVPPSSYAVQLSCPSCNGKLSALAVERVAIDVCEMCNGIWLDRGELEVALEALTKLAG